MLNFGLTVSFYNFENREKEIIYYLLFKVVLMDSSGSIQAENFKKMQEFVIEIFKNIELGPLQTRASLINFNSYPYEIFNFLNFKDFSNIKSLIENIVYNGGGTNTAAALKLANDVILNENNGMRPGTF